MEYISSSESSDNDNYTPESKKLYNYNIRQNLNDNIDSILEKNNYNNIKLCCYNINNEGLYPFLQYYLFKNPLSSLLEFPVLNTLNLHLDTDNLIEIAKGYLFLLLNNYNLDENMVFNGAMVYNEDIYVFFDLTKCNIEMDFIYKNTRIWLCLLDEIVNQMNICNIIISNNVSDFFINNSEFVFLYDKDNIIYETPSVCYVGKNCNKLNYTHLFGVSKSENTAILGPYYYFTNFKNAVKQCDYSDKFDKMGVIRFAIFTGVMKIINNFQNNKNDESLIKKEMLNDQNLNNKYEALTLRISDHDSKWIDKYDSAYIGYNIELDDGSYLKENCLTVVKEYEQQLPLTCHYIDKSSVNLEQNFSIL